MQCLILISILAYIWFTGEIAIKDNIGVVDKIWLLDKNILSMLSVPNLIIVG